MSLIEVVKEKKGSVVYKSEDIFEKSKFLCKNNHTFSLFSNDVLANNAWCSECENGNENLISNILKELNIDYKERFLINTYIYDYAITKGRRFVIFEVCNDYEKKMKEAHKDEYNVIVIFNTEEKIKEMIWNSIKDNKKTTLIGKEDLPASDHTCEI